MKLNELTVHDFIGAIAAKTPTPGGGSTAAASGAMGAGLLMMVASYVDQAEVQSAAKELDNLVKKLGALIDEDALSFEGFMAAMKLPKATDEEKAVRKEKMQSALKHASQVPLDTLKACHKACSTLETLQNHCKESMISDLGSGSSLLRSAVEGAYLNILINASSIKDEAYVRQMMEEAQSMKQECVQCFASMYEWVESKLALP